MICVVRRHKMGNEISAQTSSQDLVALMRATMGEPYAAYEAAILSDGIDGPFLLLLESKAQIGEILQDLGVTRAAHVIKLTAEVLRFIEANAAVQATGPAGDSALPANMSLSPPVPMPPSSSASPTRQRTMVFLTHNWADGNHERVTAINAALQRRGIVTWFDSDRMEGSIRRTMTEGIENTQCVMVFITSIYRDKVNGADQRDNCAYGEGRQ